MIRLAHLADSHFDERHRLEDNVAVHQAFLDQVQQADVDLIVHAGDMFERKSSIAERNALADFLTQAAGIAPVVGVRGNHDAPGDLDIFAALESRHDIYIRERPSLGESDCIRIGDVVVVALPWFDKAHVVAQYGAGVTATETDERAIAAARQMLALMGAEARNAVAQGFVPIVVGHIQVAGSVVSTGQTLIGQTVELAPGDLADIGAAYVALGHIHKHQAWGNVVYAGSPDRKNFGEPESKGWVYVEIDPDRWREPGGVRWEFRELPAREIILVEDDWTRGDAVVRVAGPDAPLAGALVRHRYRIRPEDLHLVDEGAIREAHIDAGAYDVTIEPVLVHETRARVPEIADARGTWDKLAAYYRAKGIVIDGVEEMRLRGRLAEIAAPTAAQEEA